MTPTQQRIYSNGNWRADAGKTAEQVATEMNAARISLIPGRNYTLLGIAEELTPAFTVTLEATVDAVIAALPPEQVVTGVALRQYLRMLQVSPGIDFGSADNQASIEALRPVLGDSLVDSLKSLGQSVSGPVVDATDVQAAWDWYAGYSSRESRFAEASNLLATLQASLDDPVQFDSVLAQIAGV